MVQLLEVPEPYTQGIVKSINNENQVVGFLRLVSKNSTSLRKSAVIWDKDAVILLGNLPGADESEAVSINNKSCVLCVATYGSGKFEQYISHLMNGAQLPKQETLIFGGFIYDKGKIIPMVTSGSETINIDLSKGFVPRAINDDNIIVGRATTLNGCPTAFVWRNSKMINLNTLIPGNIGWSLIDARDINSLGQIVGTAKYNRQSHAFLLTPNQQKTK